MLVKSATPKANFASRRVQMCVQPDRSGLRSLSAPISLLPVAYVAPADIRAGYLALVS